jgi:ABC-type transport system involved in cytochrome bd biosynthesis fused ATPase/permease subunit
VNDSVDGRSVDGGSVDGGSVDGGSVDGGSVDGGGAGRGLVFAGVLGTLAATSAIGLLGTSAWLISRSAQHPPVLYLMVPVAAVQAFGIGRAAFRYAERLTGHDAALRLLAGRRMAVYDTLERLAPAGLAAFRSGDLISRLIGDIDSLTDRWLRVRLPYAVAGAAGLGAIAVSATLLPAAALVLAVTLAAAAIAAPALAVLTSRHAERQLAPRRGALAATTVDLLYGAGELAVFCDEAAGVNRTAGVNGVTAVNGSTGVSGAAPAGSQTGIDAALDAVRAANAEVTGRERRSAYARGGGAAVTSLSAGTAVYAALVLGVAGVRSGAMAGVMLAVLVLIPVATHEVFSSLSPAAQQLPRLRAADARVQDVLATPAPVTEPAAPRHLPAPPYDITIRGLAARWAADGPDVLRGLDLDLPAGSRIVLTGPSGCGKTTLAMVLLRFLEPTAGRVLLGGTDITALTGDEVRSVIGICAQDAHVFDSTLRANLKLAKPDATDEELGQALYRARLTELPLDTLVGEHGAKLSGGQRQRLALARVLLANFPVVIFDEPTEHLDDATAEALTHDLLAETSGKTVLLITHRPVSGTDESPVSLSTCGLGRRGPGTLSPP